MDLCEIRTYCSPKCKFTPRTKTVTPKDSKSTLNCSINTGKIVQDMTWQEIEKQLIPINGLFFQQSDSTPDEKPSCECFPIKYASECFLPLSLLLD